MPHYRCERKETRLLAGKYDLAFPPGRASACGAKLPPVRDAVRRLAELLAHGRRRLCLSGDSLLNQVYHGRMSLSRTSCTPSEMSFHRLVLNLSKI